MIAQIQNSTLDYNARLSLQSEIIARALLFLQGQYNDADSDIGNSLAQQIASGRSLATGQEFIGWQISKKYWRQLRKAEPEIILPKKYLNHYSVTSDLLVTNHTKGTQYQLSRIGDDAYSCECEAYHAGNECGHILYAKEMIQQAIDDIDGEEVLPVAIAPIEVEPVEIELAPGMIATPGQAKALSDLMEFANGSHSLHCLTGYAGTGKTTILQAWIKMLRESGSNQLIAFAAPTNKAVQVLREMVYQWDHGIPCLTCAQLLGLKPQIDYETGKEYFVPDYKPENGPTMGNFKIVVIDECSMISEELWGYLVKEAGLLTKLLFVGDYAQLPPVGEPISKTFTEVHENNRSNLTEVKRYSGAIAELADTVRKTQDSPAIPAIRSDFNPDGSEGIWAMRDKEWAESMIQAFESTSYLSDPDFARVLAWTNKRVKSINEYIREHIRGKDAPRFVKGERLIASSHFSRKIPRHDNEGQVTGYGYKTILYTSSEMEVLDIHEMAVGSYMAWMLKVKIYSGEEELIPVLHEDSGRDFKDALNKLKKDRNWKAYYDLKRNFADVDYAYAMTVHKSQGSTFQNVWMDASDILRNRSRARVTLPTGEEKVIYERNQLLYVALSRTAKRLFVLSK